MSKDSYRRLYNHLQAIKTHMQREEQTYQEKYKKKSTYSN